ncbi:MAG: calcium/sodium antiporter [Bdellovibrionales bacterium]
MDFSLIQALLLPLVFMIAGIGLLVKGGGWTVDSAVFIARRFGISPLVVGFTIIAFGTSLPELVISVLANHEGSSGIALGNVLGSNIANVLAVIGITAIIFPLVSSSSAILKDLIMMLVCTSLLAFLMLQGDIGRLAGAAMIVLLALYVFFQYKMAKKDEAVVPDNEHSPAFAKPVYAYVFLALGLAGIALGAELLVTGARDSAKIIGVPEAVIALSVIALGTSLPELSTCIIAVRRGHHDIVLGNIIGSNVFNILMILGLTAVIKPIAAGSFAPQLINFDIWIVALTSGLFALLLVLFKGISRAAGVVFCAAYLVYNVYIYAIYISG